MAADSTPDRVLSVWQPFSPPHQLLITGTEQRLHVDDGPDDESRLDAAAYSWRLREPVFSCVEDAESRAELEGILAKLSAEEPAEQRTLAVLQEFVDTALATIESGGSAAIASQSVADADEEETEVDALLAFTHHLRWVLRCFADKPGVSVSLR